MAEICKECFIKTILTSEEQRKYIEGKLTIIESHYKDFCEGCCRTIPIVMEVKENTEPTETTNENLPKKVIVEKALLQRAADYVNAILEALDIEDEETLSYINDGYTDIIEPLVKLAFEENNSVDEFVIAKQADVQIFKENLNDIYDIDTAEIPDEEIAEIFDEVEEILAGSDEYSEIYNDAVCQVLKNHNLG